ncbi:MAG TPA: hypothetical protein VKZ91_08005 [Woeseiaceae bacterium]|nr:hypothetical protein [Woeseiaceae bacterium]
MGRFAAWTGQALLYGMFAAVIAVFSSWPTYHHLPDDHALIKLSFTHHAERMHECEEVSAEELAKLSPNMRAPVRCPRERSPVTVEVDLDGNLAYRETASPSGLSGDGAASVYRRIPVPAGVHRLSVRLRDSVRTEGFDFERSEIVDLGPAEIMVIDFDAEQGGITLQ